MNSVDLRNFYSEEVANDMIKRLHGKFVIATKVKQKRKLFAWLEKFQTKMEEDKNIGTDWFDYGFVNEGNSSTLNIEFFKRRNGKSDIMPLKINIIDFEKDDYKNLMTVIASAKQNMKGIWWNE